MTQQTAPWENWHLKRGVELLRTFGLVSPKLPSTIKAGYLNCRIRPYIPNPLRCFKCQRFGHSQKSCRGEQTCSRCASAGHSPTDCILEPKCINSSQPRPSDSKICPKWKIEKQIQEIKTNKSISYPEARKLIVPQLSQTYAQAAKSSTTNNSTQTDENITKIKRPPLKLLSSLSSKQRPNISTANTTSSSASHGRVHKALAVLKLKLQQHRERSMRERVNASQTSGLFPLRLPTSHINSPIKFPPSSPTHTQKRNNEGFISLRQTAKRVLLENPSFQINLENRFSLPTTVNSSEFPALPTSQQTTAQQNAQAGETTSSSTAANMNTTQTEITPSSQKPGLTNTSTQGVQPRVTPSSIQNNTPKVPLPSRSCFSSQNTTANN
ncbi:uncharacterized protein TNCV_859171 [Trichonephila clavipes]|nr:uncharacterized protein TNCV_859171 [Trichonephila clavipes]